MSLKNSRAISRTFIATIILAFLSSMAFAEPRPPGGAPSIPSGLTGPSTSVDGNYTISWDHDASVLNFVLEERVGSGSWSAVYSSDHPSANFSKHVVEDYSYRVKACGFFGTCSNYSYTITVDVTGGLTTPVNEGTAEVVGTLPYSIDVAADGDLRVSVPIQVTPGAGGFVPNLSLEYDSGRGIDRLERSLPEDTIGYGWRLSGVSRIRRCVVGETSTADINLTNTDKLCLDGMPLFRVSGSDFTAGAEYRTRIESFIKVEAKDNYGDLWFEVTLPDGTVRQYGNSVSSRVNKDGGVEYQWSINKETSTDGNEINYTYWFNPSTGTNRILSIDYSYGRVDFDYVTRSDTSTVNIHTTPQTLDVYLHSVRVSHSSTVVKSRDYRLISEDLTGKGRLDLIQYCGYDQDGNNLKCLAPLDFDWKTPTQTMSGVDILVDGMSDGIGAVHQVEYGTITGTSHSFLFTERPFGNGSAPTDTQELSGTGALRHVATKLRRDNGRGGFYDTSYAYQGTGLESKEHWGFLGFFAQRITEPGETQAGIQKDIVTYVQYRMDYPYHGRVARAMQYDGISGSQTETMSYVEYDYDAELISYSTGNANYPYASDVKELIYSGGSFLGATRSTNTLTLDSEFPNDDYIGKVVTKTEIGTGASSTAVPGSSGSYWGDVPTRTISGLENTTHTTVEFKNRATSGDWLIGFPESVVRESWAGGTSGTSIVQDVTMTPISGSMRVENILQFPGDSFLELSTTMSYNSQGYVQDISVSGKEVTARTSKFTGGAWPGYPQTVENAEGHVTTNSFFDPRFGTVRARVSPLQLNSGWSRDEVGRLIGHTNPDGVSTYSVFEDCSTCSSVYGVTPSFKVHTVSEEGSVQVAPDQTVYFDNIGRVVRTEIESFSGALINEDIKYDNLGRVEKATLPYIGTSPSEVSYEYDYYNRLRKVTRADNSTITTDFSVSNSHVVEEISDDVLDWEGNWVETQKKVSEYNVLGQLKKTTDGFGTTKNPATEYTYDANGNILTVVANAGSAKPQETVFEYDAAGNQKKFTQKKTTSVALRTVTSTYTALNQLWTQTDDMGQVSTYSYDKLGRIKSLTNIDGHSTWTWDTATNGIGKLSALGRTDYSETYYYESDGKLDQIRTGVKPFGASGVTYYYDSYDYDNQGRIDKITYASGLEISREYNARGYLSDLKDGLTAVHTINGRDQFGNIDDETFGNGVSTTRTFDSATGRLTNISTLISGGKTFQNEEYRWRSNGSVQEKISNAIDGISTKREERYEYDVLNRVERASTYVDGQWSRDLTYDFDNMGNLSKKESTQAGDVSVTNYLYQETGDAGPNAVTKATIGSVVNTFTYNANGAIEKYQVGSTGQIDKHIRYNAFNQPTAVVVGDGGIDDITPDAKDEFAYSPTGRRYARKTTWKDGSNTVLEEATYVGDVEIVERTVLGGSSETVTKTHVSQNVMHVEVVDSATTEFFEYAHRDHLGSIVVVTDESGDTLDNLAYELYGSRKAKDWTSNISAAELDVLLDIANDHAPKARGFTGHEYMDRTGLVHMNGRVYDPALGRFLSPDPVVQFPVYSQGWNRYGYTFNSPASLSDPSGFTSSDPDVNPDGDKQFDDFFDNVDYFDNLYQYLLNGGASYDAYTQEYMRQAQDELRNALASMARPTNNTHTRNQTPLVPAALSRQLANFPYPDSRNSTLGSLGYESASGTDYKDPKAIEKAMVNAVTGSLASLDDPAEKLAEVVVVESTIGIATGSPVVRAVGRAGWIAIERTGQALENAYRATLRTKRNREITAEAIRAISRIADDIDEIAYIDDLQNGAQYVPSNIPQYFRQPLVPLTPKSPEITLVIK